MPERAPLPARHGQPGSASSRSPLPTTGPAAFRGTEQISAGARCCGFAADAITGFSVRPLRLANYLSLLLAVCSLLTLGYVLYQWAEGATVPGWTSVMTVVLLLSSFQMLVLAIMCEYLGRLFVEAKRRPLFVIDRIIRGDAAGAADPSGADEDLPVTAPWPGAGGALAPQPGRPERRRSST